MDVISSMESDSEVRVFGKACAGGTVSMVHYRCPVSMSHFVLVGNPSLSDRNQPSWS